MIRLPQRSQDQDVLSNQHENWATIISTLAFYASSLMFSAFHLLAWNWYFPSHMASVAWRVFVVSTMGITVVLMVLSCIISNKLPASFVRLENFIYRFWMIISVTSRIGLIALVFYCFSSTPEEVYKNVEWTDYLPHFS